MRNKERPANWVPTESELRRLEGYISQVRESAMILRVIADSLIANKSPESSLMELSALDRRLTIARQQALWVRRGFRLLQKSKKDALNGKGQA